MKAQLLQISAVLMLLGRLAAAQVYPPTPGDLKVTVPFEFAVSGRTKTMPAGNYIIHQTKKPDVIEFCEDGAYCATVSLAPVTLENGKTSQAPAERRLVFRQKGDQRFLSQIWLTPQSGRRPSTAPLQPTGADRSAEVEMEVEIEVEIEVEAHLLCIHFAGRFPTSWH